MKVLVRSFMFIIFATLFVVQTTQASCWNLKDASCLAPSILGQKYGDEIREWSAINGMVTTLGKSIFFKFKFDDEAIEILHSNALLGLEIEALVQGSKRDGIEISGVAVGSKLRNAQVGIDTEASDFGDTRSIGAHLLNLQHLEADKWYKLIIQTNNFLPTSGITIRPSIQLTLDVVGYSRMYAVLGPLGWLSNEVADLYEQIGQYKYFALETDLFGASFTPAEKGENRRGVFWTNHENSHPFSTGGELYGPWPFIGPILNPSSDRDGDVGSSDGGDPNNTTEGTGNGYNYDQGDNTWSGYDHDVGLKYLRIGKKSSSRWKGSKVWSISQIPEKRDFRIKLKRKGEQWKDKKMAIKIVKFFKKDSIILVDSQ